MSTDKHISLTISETRLIWIVRRVSGGSCTFIKVAKYWMSWGVK